MSDRKRRKTVEAPGPLWDKKGTRVPDPRPLPRPPVGANRMTRTAFLAAFTLGICYALPASAADLVPAQLDIIKGHHDSIQSVAFTPKGDHVVSVAYKEIILWDLVDPAKSQVFNAFQANEYTWGTPRVRADGQYIAIPGTYYVNANDITYPVSIRLYQVEITPDKGARILAAGEVGRTQADDFEHDTMTDVAFSPTDSRLAGVRYNSAKKKYVLGLYDQISRVTNNDAVFTSDVSFKVAFLTDGKTIVTADAKGKLMLWKFAKPSGGPYDVSKSAVNDLAVSPDGKTLAVACDDKTVKVWDLEKNEVKHTLTGHTEPVLCVSFSKDGKYLASGGKDHDVKLWDAANGKELATGRGHVNNVTCVAFSPNGKGLVTGGADKEIHLWDLEKTLKGK
jgi:WD40 repeat protein